MPSKGQIEAERQAEARRVAARARLESDVHSALADRVDPAEIVRIVSRVLREHGLLASAAAVVTESRPPRKK